MTSLTDLQDFSSPHHDPDDPYLGLTSDRANEVFLVAQLRILAKRLMELVPQVQSVTLGSGMGVDSEHAPTTTYQRHSYWCNGSWVLLAVEYPCCCREPESLELRRGHFVRWKYSL
jgi:hypothetical protein